MDTRKIRELINIFETTTTGRENVVNSIYAILIDGGLLPSEIADRNFIEDFLLIDLQYEFARDRKLKDLVFFLKLTAEADISVDS